jgi:hypothetical protein
MKNGEAGLRAEPRDAGAEKSKEEQILKRFWSEAT